MKNLLKTIILSFVAVSLCITPCFADGNKLLEACQDAENALDNREMNIPVNAGFCVGLVQGVRHTLIYLNESLPNNMKLCFPDKGMQNSQAIRVVLKYLRNNPENLHMDETLLVMMAYASVYKCK